MRRRKWIKHTRWNTCSRRISSNRLFKSFTLCVISEIFPESSVSILLVAPIAMSKANFTVGALESHPWLCESGVKQILCWPASAAVKVNRPSLGVRWETTRWSLSKVSSTVMRTCREESWIQVFDSLFRTSALYVPAYRLLVTISLTRRYMSLSLTNNQCILGQFFKEALSLLAFHVYVECACLCGQHGQDGEECQQPWWAGSWGRHGGYAI